MLKIQSLALAFAAAATLSSPVKADSAGLAGCQAAAQANYYHDLALCDQRGFGGSCQQDAFTKFSAAWANCSQIYG